MSAVGGAAVSPASRRRPTRVLFLLFGSTEREGRIRVRRRVTCVAVFGNIDLDLRQATFERDVVTVFLSLGRDRRLARAAGMGAAQMA